MFESQPRSLWRLLLPGAGVLLLAGIAGAWWLSREPCRMVFTAHTGAVRCLALSSDGQLLATGGSDRAVRLWKLPSRSAVATLSGHNSSVAAVAVSPDGSLVASGSSDGMLKLWDVASGSERSSKRGHRNGVSALLFTPDGKTLISGGTDRLIRLWDVQTGNETKALRGQKGAIWSLALSSDGQTLASGSSGDFIIRLWKLPGPSPVGELRGHQARVMALAFAGDGKLLSGDRTGMVKVWDLKTRQDQSFQAHRDRISGLAGLPAADGLLSASEDRELARWSLSSLPDMPVRWQQRSLVHALALIPDGSAVVTAGADGRVRVWDIPAR